MGREVLQVVCPVERVRVPVAARTSETYNNFRQWVEWAGVPWSDYGCWHFRARWKDQKVTLNITKVLDQNTRKSIEEKLKGLTDQPEKAQGRYLKQVSIA